MSGAKGKGIIAGIAALLIFILVGVGLYLLGGDDQSALEKLRDIAVIFIVLASIITVILLAAITAALAILVFQIKDRVIPLLEEATGTVKRIRGTTNFMTEEAVKPLIGLVGTFRKYRSYSKTVAGKTTKPKIKLDPKRDKNANV